MSPLEKENLALKRKVYKLKIKRRQYFFFSLASSFVAIVSILGAIFSTIHVDNKGATLNVSVKKFGGAQMVLANGYMTRDELSDLNLSVCNCILTDAKLEAEEKIDAANEKAASIRAQRKFKVTFSEKYKLAKPIYLTDDEFNLLCHLVYAEAGNQSTIGQQAVCWVVLNRLASPKYPNSIYKVIYAPGQFDPVQNGSINKRHSQETKNAVKSVLSGNIPDMTYGALFFCDPSISKASNLAWFATLTKTTTIGCHSFYK